MKVDQVPIDFSRAENTIIVSDIHLADAEPPHPSNPLWKRFKRPELFIDSHFRSFLLSIRASLKNTSSPIELVLNGDTFDFDSVMKLPEKMHLTWLEKKRGLNSEEQKSRFKIRTILNDHPIWVQAMRDFISEGHRVIFVFGNHDIELHWPSVQQELLDHLCANLESRERIRFCEWFYISNRDTLIEHGNQYDAYSLCANPINPLIRKGSKVFVRIPFGNLAGKYMLNGMGLMNPHADSSFIKSTVWEYMIFYYRYIMKTQPLILFTWFWSATVTLIHSVSEGLLPAMTDPLTVDSRIEGISARANATTRMIWGLRELHAHPAIFRPWEILKELWLDRAFILILMLFVSFQFFSVATFFTRPSYLWFLVPLTALMPVFIFYSRSVQSQVAATLSAAQRNARLAARITRVSRVVHGHTHLETHDWISGPNENIEYLNTGTWSPAFEDVECTRPYGKKCFAWLRPSRTGPGNEREAVLMEWNQGNAILLHERNKAPVEAA